MQAGVGLLVADVMPIYMIIPRYSHNYAQFCQLLNSNSFTHRKIPMLLREATSETYGPRVFLIISISITLLLLWFLLCLLLFTLHLSIKNTKNIISIRSHSRKSPWRDWQPLSIGCELLSFCVGTRDLCVASYWIDTLVLKTEGNTYATLQHHSLLFGEIQRSAQEVARRISGAVAGEIYAKPIHTKYTS